MFITEQCTVRVYGDSEKVFQYGMAQNIENVVADERLAAGDEDVHAAPVDRPGVNPDGRGAWIT